MTERPNIRRMQVPERNEKRPLDFDPLRDITNENWDNIQGELQACLHNAEWTDFACLAARVKNIDPSKDVEVSDADWKTILSARKQALKDGLIWQKDIDLLASLRTLRPEAAEFESSNRKRWEDYLKMIKSDVLGTQRKIYWADVAFCAAQLQKAYPKNEPRISDADWDAMVNELLAFRARGEFTQSYQMAANMRILRDKPGVLQYVNELDKALALLERHRKEHSWALFCHVAERLKILAAKEVKMTEDGLRFVMPERDHYVDSLSKSQPEALEI